MSSEPKQHKVLQGGLMRCCLQTLGDVPTDKLQEFKDGDELDCNSCDQSMIVHEENGEMIWRWHRKECVMRVDAHGKIYISEGELIALLVKLRDKNSAHGLNGAFDVRLDDNPMLCQDNDFWLFAETDAEAMSNTPPLVNPLPIISGQHTSGIRLVRNELIRLTPEIEKRIDEPIF